MTLLTLKQQIKKNKPKFYRQNHEALPRIKTSWRKPKGIHSKLRHGFAGHRNTVEPGYGTPASLRGVGKEGLIPVLVNTLQELATLDAKKQGIIIAHVGTKKKTEIIKAAQEKKLTILNLKNPAQFLTKTEAELKKRKETKKTKTTEKQPKQDETKQQKKTEDQTKEEQKKELDKLLTKKEQ
ncbi:hypothetical protein HY485_05400 [Candidatus Woesearchaeota archaeon]|nr:hypothetical protein [Candidatus Woesearchaeota archaeon]